MGQYGRAAINAWHALCKKAVDCPFEAWKVAIAEETEKQSIRDKECPMFTFLGLCEEGFVKDVKAGDYVGKADSLRHYTQNKNRAIFAVKELRNDPSLADNKKKLWMIVGNGESDNRQLDVILSLWNNGMILS